VIRRTGGELAKSAGFGWGQHVVDQDLEEPDRGGVQTLADGDHEQGQQQPPAVRPQLPARTGGGSAATVWVGAAGTTGSADGSDSVGRFASSEAVDRAGFAYGGAGA